MKTLITLSFFGTMLLATSFLQAQNCSAYKRASCDNYSSRKCCLSSCARALASLDQDIICIPAKDSYTSKFLRKTICVNTGTVSYQELEYDHHHGLFVAKSNRAKDEANQSSCRTQCLQTDPSLANAGQVRT